MRCLEVAAIIAGIFLAPLFASPTFADTVLSVQPPSSTVGAASTFAVGVNISGVADLYAFQFDLSFNPAVLQATNVLEGVFLSGGGTTFFIPGTIDNTAGTIAFNADALLGAIPGVSGNGGLVEFDFTALAPGISDLAVSNVILQDSTLATIGSATTDGSVTVQGTATVPEPSSLTLLSMGLLALAGFTLKKTIL